MPAYQTGYDFFSDQTVLAHRALIAAGTNTCENVTAVYRCAKLGLNPIALASALNDLTEIDAHIALRALLPMLTVNPHPTRLSSVLIALCEAGILNRLDHFRLFHHLTLTESNLVFILPFLKSAKLLTKENITALTNIDYITLLSRDALEDVWYPHGHSLTQTKFDDILESAKYKEPLIPFAKM